MKVHKSRLKDRTAPLPEGYTSEREVEHRFKLNYSKIGATEEGKPTLDDVDNFFAMLRTIPGTYARKIDQVNVDVYKNKKQKEDETVSYRLRKTMSLWPDDFKEEMFRITLKTSVGSADIDEKEETQRQFDLLSGKTSAEDKQDFLRLFHEKGMYPNARTRIYVPHKLPNGNMCEIHLETYNLPESATDVIRIEVEFASTADAEEARKPGALPEWIGEEVTDRKEWKSKRLIKNGPPEDAKKDREMLRENTLALRARQEEECKGGGKKL
jgi:hypothetical protein